MRIRDRFPVILFDMNSTFAFGEDRFGDGEDFSLAYRALGGTPLSAARVNAVIRACFAHLRALCDDHADYLRRLSREHVLALASNVWAPKDRFVREFERAGIESVFRVRVFSSDTRSVKPSGKLCRAALDALGASPADALFVGDSLERDVAPARRLGAPRGSRAIACARS